MQESVRGDGCSGFKGPSCSFEVPLLLMGLGGGGTGNSPSQHDPEKHLQCKISYVDVLELLIKMPVPG